MNAKNRTLVAASLVGFLLLGGCSAAKTPTAPASANSSPAAGQKVSSNFQPVVHVIGATRRAVKAGDFATAKTEFAKFPTQWSKVQAEVKTKSPDAYSEVESAQQQVTTALQSGDQAKAMIGLRALKVAVVKASK